MSTYKAVSLSLVGTRLLNLLGDQAWDPQGHLKKQ